MDIPITLRAALVVGRYLARQDIPEEREGIEERFVVDLGIEVLDKDVPNARSAQRRIALGPHDAARFTLDKCVIHLLEGTLGIGNVVEIDVRVAQATARHGVTAHADRGNRADRVEDFEEQALGGVWGEVPNVAANKMAALMIATAETKLITTTTTTTTSCSPQTVRSHTLPDRNDTTMCPSHVALRSSMLRLRSNCDSMHAKPHARLQRGSVHVASRNDLQALPE